MTRREIGRPARGDERDEGDGEADRDEGEDDEGAVSPDEEGCPHERQGDEEREQEPAAAREAPQGRHEQVPGLPAGRQAPLLVAGHLEARRQTQVADDEWNRGERDQRDRQGGPQRSPAPQPEPDARLDRCDEPAVGMDGHEQPGPGRRPGGRARRPHVERAREEVGGQCPGERHERVHAPEAAVHGEDSRAPGQDGGARARDRSPEPAAEVVGDGDGRRREDDREPAERRRVTVHGERGVGEEEVERRTAPLPEDGDDDLGQRAGRDEAADRLVLEERLPVHVGDDPREQDPDPGRDAADGEETRAHRASRRRGRMFPRGRPAPAARARGRLRATRRRR